MSVCQIVEELNFIQPGEITYLYLPLAHVFALLAQLASFDEGTAIVYFGGDSKQILKEIIETRPTYLPSVPRIFEKLYAGCDNAMQEQASEEDQPRFRQAIALGVRGTAAPAARRTGPRGAQAPAVRAGRQERSSSACPSCSAVRRARQ